MALKQIDFGSNEYKQVVQLREAVLRKPLGLGFTENELQQEANNIHIACMEDDVMWGCCMLVPSANSELRLRQMAVAPQLHGKGIGASIMNFAENLARDKGYKKIVMHARDTAIGFYEKLGYNIKGEQFTEVSVPHHVMEKKLV
jgi:predicted GNAT family N-acyltransferase